MIKKWIILYFEHISIGLIGIEIAILLFLSMFPNWFTIPYGVYFSIKSFIFILQLRFMVIRRSWLLTHGVLRSLFTDVSLPSGLLVSQLILYLLYLSYLLPSGFFALTNVLIALSQFMFFMIYPRTFYYYLSNTDYNGYIEEYHLRSKIDIDEILSMTIIFLMVSFGMGAVILAKSNFELFQLNTILELATVLGILFLPVMNYLTLLINKRYYEIMEKLSKGEKPVEFWRARWRLRG